jgi:hypothetical protein
MRRIIKATKNIRLKLIKFWRFSMNFRPLGMLISVLIPLALFLTACPSKNNPSSPISQPTATNTSCMDSNGHTCTPTNTPTATNTPCDTGSYSISGSVTYMGPTNAGATLVVMCPNLPGTTANCNGTMATIVPGTAGSYSVTGFGPGTYDVAGLYDTFSASGSPNLGGYAAFYNGPGSVICSTNSAKVTITNSSPTGINFSFGTSYQIYGVNVNVSYTGTETNQLNVGIYATSSYSTPINGGILSDPGGSLSIIDNHNPCGSETVYVMVWNGTNLTPNPGDDFIQWGSTPTVDNPTYSIGVTFGTNPWP